MIQDISPRQYDNAFLSKRAPKDSDLLLLYKGKEVLLEKAKEEEKQILYPTVAQLPAAEDGEFQATSLEEEKSGRYRVAGHLLIYLFSIDETAFYSIDGWDGEIEGFHWGSDSIFRNGGYLAFAGITGMQLYRWRMDHNFCGRCGHAMEPSLTERAFCCPQCGSIVYPKICPAVIVAVTHKDRILVTRYAGRAVKSYALIAGFAEVGETIEETVHREVMEEVGLKVKNLRFYKSQPWSFSDTLLMGFYCELDGGEAIHLDEEELAEAGWLSREELPDRSGEISLTSEMMERFRQGLE